MDIRSLRYFLAVADEGTFRKGAESTHVSQPAISQAIAQLEDELGVRLFDRLGRRVALTPDGSLLLEPTRRILRDVEQLSHLVDRERGVVRGRLELGTTDAASIYMLPPIYRAFRREYPEAELSVRVEGTGSLLGQLVTGAIELAVINLSVGDRVTPLPASHLSATPVHREELEFVVSARDPLADREVVSLEEVAVAPFITFKGDSITRTALEGLLVERGLSLNVAMEISSPEAIKKLVEVGLGASLLPARSVQGEVRAGRLRVLTVPGEKLSRTLGMVRDDRRALSPAADALASLTRRMGNLTAA